MPTIVIENINKINPAAKEFINSLGNHKIIAFYGDMGVGKTTFIKAICTELGVETNITSPTFAIVNEYTTKSSQTIYHFDLYRIKNLQELLDVGFEEYLYSDSLLFIEWPEIALDLLPDNTLHVKILDTIDGTRTINY